MYNLALKLNLPKLGQTNNFDGVCKAAPGKASGSAQHVFYIELKHTTVLNIKIGDLFSALCHI